MPTGSERVFRRLLRDSSSSQQPLLRDGLLDPARELGLNAGVLRETRQKVLARSRDPRPVPAVDRGPKSLRGRRNGPDRSPVAVTERAHGLEDLDLVEIRQEDVDSGETVGGLPHQAQVLLRDALVEVVDRSCDLAIGRAHRLDPEHGVAGPGRRARRGTARPRWGGQGACHVTAPARGRTRGRRPAGDGEYDGKDRRDEGQRPAAHAAVRPDPGHAGSATAVSTTDCVATTSPMTLSLTCSAQWHAVRWPASTGRSGGSSVTQISGLPSFSRNQHRVWNLQPDGGAAGDGTSPFRTRRLRRRRGSGLGIADRSATVYG